MNSLFLVIFLSSVKLLKFLNSVNRQVRFIFRMIIGLASVVLSFLLLVFLVIFSFAISGWLIVSSEIYEFATLTSSIVNLLRWTVSDLPYDQLIVASTLGHVYYFFWTLSLTLILLNVFLAVILMAWDIVANEEQNVKKSDGWLPLQLSVLLGGCFESCKKVRKSPRTDWLEEPSQWRRVYPAGCPDRRLKDYLINQMALEDGDCEEIMTLIDLDKSGTIEWDELSTVLLKLKPNLTNHSFTLRRKQTQKIKECQNGIGESIGDLNKTFGEYKGKLQTTLDGIDKILEGMDVGNE